jgi:thioredoxin-related protein
MSTVTYQNDEVIHEINEWFIPLKLECNFVQPTEFMKKYHVRWTPTLYILDTEGRPQFHTVGYLPPEELVGHLELFRAMATFDQMQLEQAAVQLRDIAEKYPASGAAPKAIYYEGVAKYMKEHDGRYLKRAFIEIRERYPESIWSKKASPFREEPD